MKLIGTVSAGIAVAMIITSLVLPGRSQQEATALGYITAISKGTILTVQGK